MNRMQHKRPAFTLVELLVVMAIIGVLISMAFVGINIAQRSSRDQERVLVAQQIRSAIDSYFRSTNSYPVLNSTLVWNTNSVQIGSQTVALSGNKSYNATVTDTTKTAYFYAKDRSGYIICVKLEVGGWDRSGNGGDALKCP